MFKLELKIFRLEISIDIAFRNADKRNKQIQKPDTHVEPEEQLSIFDDMNEIELTTQRYMEELSKSEHSTHEIPFEEDVLPPRYGISDDVEIITDSYEREVEDVIEGRR